MPRNAYPQSLRNLIQCLSRLPGIGEKSATRIAMHLLRSSEKESARLAEAIVTMKKSVHTCERCYHFTDDRLCPICSDPSRQKGQLCVVESTADLLAIEDSGAYDGVYHVLQGALAPMDGIGPDDLTIEPMLKRLTKEGIREVILATNPSGEGEATAIYLAKLIKSYPVTVTRIAYGIPMGGDLKYIDKVTLERSLTGRRPL